MHGDIVNEVQSAFVADFEKAYDSVRRDYLDDAFKKFGFGDRWCGWIQDCLRSSWGSVIGNGSPTEEFQFFKGLKQDDPLSSFLFILIMESLHVSFQRVVDAGQWSDSNINTIVHVFECFHRASGLRINMSKSKLMGIAMDVDRVEQAASKIGQGLSRLFMVMMGKLAEIRKAVIHLYVTLSRRWRFSRSKVLIFVFLCIKSWEMRRILLSRRMCGEEIWCLNTGFQDYMLWSRTKRIDVAAKLAHSSVAYSFRCALRSGKEQSQLADLLTTIEGVYLVFMNDRWVWSLEGSGIFSVASVRKLIDDRRLSDVSSKTRWIKAVPIKVNVHACNVRLDSLPTRLNISRRCMDIASIFCPIYGNAVESSRHLFFDCHVAKDLF
uniref:RNA-directed DNA polymerase, eukaryota n=1 Tax=Tanacetum cinerariifolium TaxID=118510 RepID=A0A6L2KTD4_TANCI|nr:RNA-directed DNA polymerase, eukaryota [Tanacetum cinerariifolium]